MNAQYGTEGQKKSNGSAAVGIGFILLFCGALQGAAAIVDRFLGCLAGQFLQTLPGLLVTVARALGSHLLDLQHFLDCYRLLTSLLPLAHCLLR